MSEQEENVTEEVTDQEEPKGSSITSLEDALKVIDKLRNENAAKRVKAKEVEDKAKLWEEHMKSQMTEVEKLTESNANLLTQLEEIKFQSLREKVAVEEKVPEALREFLTGTDENELRAKAKKLAAVETKGEQGKPPTDFYAGQRGAPVQPNKEPSLNDVFADMWRNVEESSTKRSSVWSGEND